MPAAKRELLSGWGHCPVDTCLSYRPEKHRDLGLILREHAGPLLPRGLGRSYGDAALQPEGVIRTERLDHFISFDARQGIVQAQAGVTLAELMDLSIPHGWLPPVIPGTRHVTLGGAFACNVHGKNHWREGEFAEHVAAIRLTTAGGDSVECSPQEHSELFWATAGGMGMTGIIEEVTLKLKPIASASLKTLSYRVESIEDMVAAFEHYRGSSDYMIGWIDHMARGDEIGRGVFEAANPMLAGDGGAALNKFRPLATRLSVPFFMPPFLLNRYSMALYNRWRFKRYSSERQSAVVDFNSFFHPLDAIGGWNRLYGRRGFFQYQCLLPETQDIAARLKSLLSAIQKHGGFSFLAVLKYHREGKGMLTFSKQGYSLALDFPNTRRVRKLLPQLDRWVAEHGGRVYLAKDALLAPELFRQMYPQAGDWCDFIRDLDPGGKFRSRMSDRLEWKPHD
ncbi:MAG: FAD-binding oxidoreductase [Pseudomonadota bacterium]|nr:FAD-binding oxidoreductase [Pseudomonadota bacterium]